MFTRLLLLLLIISGCTEMNNREDTVYNRIYDSASQLYSYGKGGNPLKYVDSSYRFLKHPTPYGLFKKYLFKKNYYYKSNEDSSNVYLDSMFRVMQDKLMQDRHPQEYGFTLNSVGDKFFDQGNLDMAFQFYYKTKQFAESSGETCAMGNVSYHLGMVTYRQSKFKEAIRYFKESYTENAACSFDSLPYYRGQELLNNIGLSYSRLSQFDSAIDYYSRALAYVERSTGRFPSRVSYFTRARGVIFGNLGVVFGARGDYKAAETLLRQSIDINGRPGYENQDAELAQVHLAEQYVKQNQLNEADIVLTAARRNLDTLPNPAAEREWLLQMSKWCQGKNDWRNATIYLDKYRQLRDSMLVNNRRLRELDAAEMLKNLDNTYRYEVLRKENQLQKVYLGVTIAIGILVLITVVHMFNGNKKFRKNLNELLRLNEEIQNQKLQLQNAIEQLNRTSAEKDRLLKIVAHDLRSPVGGIAAMLKIMLEQHSLPDSAKQYLQMMRKSAENTLNLIQDMLDVNKVGSSNIAIKEETSINNIVKDCVALIQYRAEEKQQILSVEQEEEPVLALVDGRKIIRVINNLVGNAIKFSPARSKIIVQVKRTGESFLITVKDNGTGIEKSLMETLFEGFAVPKKTGTSGEKSYGMGLPICKQFVEAHGGSIWIESQPGHGATFFVQIPLQKHSAQASPIIRPSIV